MKHKIGSQVVLIDDINKTIHTVVSNPANVVGLSNGKFYLSKEVKPVSSNLDIGDRFYFFQNQKKSESIKVGYKGTVNGFWNGEVECDGMVFLKSELKPLITCRAVLGNDL